VGPAIGPPDRPARGAIGRFARAQERGLHGAAAMSKQPHITLIGAALALSVLGCRNEGMDEHDRTRSPAVQPGEPSPPIVEDEDELGDDDSIEERYPERGPRPMDDDPLGDPFDPDMPEAGDPGADPKQPPPPRARTHRG
jgi:hypothetical protein